MNTKLHAVADTHGRPLHREAGGDGLILLIAGFPMLGRSVRHHRLVLEYVESGIMRRAKDFA